MLNTAVSNSELCEILQVSSVTLKNSNTYEMNISHEISSDEFCPRCRRFTTLNGVCVRCEDVLKSKNMSMS